MDFDEEILNAGLHLALEFGPDLNQPVNGRLNQKFTTISDQDLSKINVLCYQIRDEGHQFIYKTLEALANKRQTISAFELEFQLSAYLLSKYLWINADNMARIQSQGCYYAYKDGLIDALEP